MKTTAARAPIAHWRLTEGFDSAGLLLRDGPGSAVTRVGDAVRFDGVNDYLLISSDEVGALDVARAGHAVTVVALVRRDSLDTGFIAGLWQEHDHDPRRQYGLFVSLPTYGGGQQVIGHVSSDGAPSDDLPYSRDYSASARMVAPGQWRVIGFTYDGEHVTSFLDGVADSRPSFTERGAPLGAQLSYAKNPYHYPHGLNADSTSEFTVGAVRLTHGMGNFFRGDIAEIAVWDTALDAAQMMDVALEWTPAGAPLIWFDFFRPSAGADRLSGGWDGERWPVQAVGWTGDDIAWVEPGRIVYSGRGAVAFTGIAGLRADSVDVTFAGTAELELLVRDGWLEGMRFILDGSGSISDVRVVRRNGAAP